MVGSYAQEARRRGKLADGKSNMSRRTSATGSRSSSTGDQANCGSEHRWDERYNAVDNLEKAMAILGPPTSDFGSLRRGWAAVDTNSSDARRDEYAAPTAASLVAAVESKASRGPGNGHRSAVGGLRRKMSGLSAPLPCATNGQLLQPGHVKGGEKQGSTSGCESRADRAAAVGDCDMESEIGSRGGSSADAAANTAPSKEGEGPLSGPTYWVCGASEARGSRSSIVRRVVQATGTGATSLFPTESTKLRPLSGKPWTTRSFRSLMESSCVVELSRRTQKSVTILVSFPDNDSLPMSAVVEHAAGATMPFQPLTELRMERQPGGGEPLCHILHLGNDTIVSRYLRLRLLGHREACGVAGASTRAHRVLSLHICSSPGIEAFWSASHHSLESPLKKKPTVHTSPQSSVERLTARNGRWLSVTGSEESGFLKLSQSTWRKRMSESGCRADVPSAATRRLRSAGASSSRHQEAARDRVLDLLSSRQLSRVLAPGRAGASSIPHTVDEEEVQIIEQPDDLAVSAAHEDEAVTEAVRSKTSKALLLSENRVVDWAGHVSARGSGSSPTSVCPSNVQDDAPSLPLLGNHTGSDEFAALPLGRSDAALHSGRGCEGESPRLPKARQRRRGGRLRKSVAGLSLRGSVSSIHSLTKLPFKMRQATSRGRSTAGKGASKKQFPTAQAPRAGSPLREGLIGSRPAWNAGRPRQKSPSFGVRQTEALQRGDKNRIPRQPQTPGESFFSAVKWTPESRENQPVRAKPSGSKPVPSQTAPRLVQREGSPDLIDLGNSPPPNRRRGHQRESLQTPGAVSPAVHRKRGRSSEEAAGKLLLPARRSIWKKSEEVSPESTPLTQFRANHRRVGYQSIMDSPEMKELQAQIDATTKATEELLSRRRIRYSSSLRNSSEEPPSASPAKSGQADQEEDLLGTEVKGSYRTGLLGGQDLEVQLPSAFQELADGNDEADALRSNPLWESFEGKMRRLGVADSPTDPRYPTKRGESSSFRGAQKLAKESDGSAGSRLVESSIGPWKGRGNVEPLRRPAGRKESGETSEGFDTVELESESVGFAFGRAHLNMEDSSPRIMSPPKGKEPFGSFKDPRSSILSPIAESPSMAQKSSGGPARASLPLLVRQDSPELVSCTADLTAAQQPPLVASAKQHWNGLAESLPMSLDGSLFLRPRGKEKTPSHSAVEVVQNATMPPLLGRTEEGGPLGHGLRASMDGGSNVFSASPLAIPLLSPTGTDDESSRSPPMQERLYEGIDWTKKSLINSWDPLLMEGRKLEVNPEQQEGAASTALGLSLQAAVRAGPRQDKWAALWESINLSESFAVPTGGEGQAAVAAEDDEAAESSQASCVGGPSSENVTGGSEEAVMPLGASVAVEDTGADMEWRKAPRDPFSAEEMERMFDALPAGASGFSLKLATEAARGGQQLRRGICESAAGRRQGWQWPQESDNKEEKRAPVKCMPQPLAASKTRASKAGGGSPPGFRRGTSKAQAAKKGNEPLWEAFNRRSIEEGIVPSDIDVGEESSSREGNKQALDLIPAHRPRGENTPLN